MLKLVLLVAVVVAVTDQHTVADLDRCPELLDVDDPKVLAKLDTALSNVETSEQVDQVLSILVQLIAGYKQLSNDEIPIKVPRKLYKLVYGHLYYVRFHSKQGKKCELEWAEDSEDKFVRDRNLKFSCL